MVFDTMISKVRILLRQTKLFLTTILNLYVTQPPHTNFFCLYTARRDILVRIQGCRLVYAKMWLLFLYKFKVRVLDPYIVVFIEAWLLVV